jgi:DNA-binding SARP family transcriptional activator
MWTLTGGDLEGARPIADRATELSEPRFMSGVIVSAFVRWMRGEDDTGEGILTAVERAREVAQPRDRARCDIYRALAHAYAGRPAEAADAIALALQAEPLLASTFATATLRVGEAAVAVASGDESDAAERLRSVGDELARDEFQTIRGVQPFFTLAYVLDRRARDHFDRADLARANLEARDVARAFVALREQDDMDEIRSITWPSRARLGVLLPRRWLTEWAIAGVGAGVAEARTLIDHLIAVDPLATLERITTLAQDASPNLASSARTLLASLPSPPRQIVRLNALGPLQLMRGATLVDDKDWQRNRVRILLLYLVVHRRTLREVVATALWPDRDEDATANNLAVTLNYLNRVLEPERERGTAPWFVRSDGSYLELTGGEWFTVDGWELERLVREADAAPSVGRSLELYEEAITLWRGEWLEGIDEDWALVERDRLRAVFVRACVRAGEFRLAARDFDTAVAYGERAAKSEPWSEPAFRLIVAAHLSGGDRAAARHAADRCRAMLAELGVEPEAATAMVLRSVDAPR